MWVIFKKWIGIAAACVQKKKWLFRFISWWDQIITHMQFVCLCIYVCLSLYCMNICIFFPFQTARMNNDSNFYYFHFQDFRFHISEQRYVICCLFPICLFVFLSPVAWIFNLRPSLFQYLPLSVDVVIMSIPVVRFSAFILSQSFLECEGVSTNKSLTND